MPVGCPFRCAGAYQLAQGNLLNEQYLPRNLEGCQMLGNERPEFSRCGCIALRAEHNGCCDFLAERFMRQAERQRPQSRRGVRAVPPQLPAG